MKHIIKLLLSISLFSILMTLTGCFDPIFYEIRKDVKPEKVEEKILLPVNVLFINLAIEIPVTSEDMQGKGKVTKDELLEYLNS